MLRNNAVTTYLKTGEREDIENCCLRAESYIVTDTSLSELWAEARREGEGGFAGSGQSVQPLLKETLNWIIVWANQQKSGNTLLTPKCILLPGANFTDYILSQGLKHLTCQCPVCQPGHLTSPPPWCLCLQYWCNPSVSIAHHPRVGSHKFSIIGLNL